MSVPHFFHEYFLCVCHTNGAALHHHIALPVALPPGRSGRHVFGEGVAQLEVPELPHGIPNMVARHMANENCTATTFHLDTSYNFFFFFEGLYFQENFI